MTHWLEDRFLDFSYTHQGILLQLLNSEHFIDVFTEIHPSDTLLPASLGVDAIHFQQFLELLVSECDVLTVKDASKLLPSDDVLPESVEIEEKLSNSDAFESDLCLDSTKNIFNRFCAVWQPLVDVELLSKGVLVQIKGNIFERVYHLRIGDNSLDGQSLNLVDVFDFLDEILIANLFGIAAAGIPTGQQVSQFLVSHKAQIIENSNELLPRDHVAVGAVVVLQRWLYENSLARHRPTNIVQHLLHLTGLLAHTAIVAQLGQICLGEVGIAELLVDVSHQVRILDEVPGLEAVLVGEGLDFLCGEVHIEEAECGGESGDEFILDAVSLSEFVVVFEEGLHADLLLPDFGADARFDVLYGGDAIDAADWVKKMVRDWVAACLKMEVISYILLLLYISHTRSLRGKPEDKVEIGKEKYGLKEYN